MRLKLIPLLFAAVVLSGAWTSCKKQVTDPPTDTTHHPCDTCNLNQDSLQRIKDSLAHAFSWKQFSVPGEVAITGVWVFGDNDIYVLGSSLWHYDGAAFTLVNIVDRTHNTMLNGALADDQLFAFSKSDFWITSYGGEALHTSDGKNCDDFRFGGVNACWGTSSNDMYFVGHGGLIWHYDGVKFDTMTSNTTDDLLNVWGTSDNNIWACNTNLGTGKLTLIHYDGTQWSPDPFASSPDAQASGGIYGVWTTDSASHVVTTISAGYVFRKTDNGPWRKDSYVPNKYLDSSLIPIGDLRGNGADDISAAGSYAWFAHWNGKTWKRMDDIYDPKIGQYYIEALHQKGNTICVGGQIQDNSWVAVGTRKQ